MRITHILFSIAVAAIFPVPSRMSAEPLKSAPAHSNALPWSKVVDLTADCTKCSVTAIVAEATSPELSLPPLCIENPVVDRLLVGTSTRKGIIAEIYLSDEKGPRTELVTLLLPGTIPSANDAEIVAGVYCFPRWTADGQSIVPRMAQMSASGTTPRGDWNDPFDWDGNQIVQIEVVSNQSGAKVWLKGTAGSLNTTAVLNIRKSRLSALVISSLSGKVQQVEKCPQSWDDALNVALYSCNF